MCAFMIAGSSIQQAVEAVIALPAGDRQVAVDRILWRAFVAREYRAAVRTALSRRADICLLQADDVLFSDDGEAVMRIVDVGDQIAFRWRGGARITRRAPDELAALLAEGGFQRALPEHAYSWWTTWARTIPPHEPPEVEIATKSTQIVVRRLCHRALYANLVDMEQQPIIAHEYTASILEYLLAEEAAMSIVATADATDQYQRRLKARLAESRRLFPPGQWQPGDIREWALMQMESGAWFQDPKPKEQEKLMASIYTEDVVRGWYARLAAGEITQEALAAEVGCSSATISVRLKNLGLRLPRRATSAAPVPARAEAKETATATARKRQRRQQARKSPAPPVEVTPAPTVATAIVPASPTPPAPNPNGNGHIQLAQAQAAAEWLRGLLNELQGAGAQVSGSVSVSLNLSVDVPIGGRNE